MYKQDSIRRRLAGALVIAAVSFPCAAQARVMGDDVGPPAASSKRWPPDRPDPMR
jgi:hypothetical protein